MSAAVLKLASLIWKGTSACFSNFGSLLGSCRKREVLRTFVCRDEETFIAEIGIS